MYTNPKCKMKDVSFSSNFIIQIEEELFIHYAYIWHHFKANEIRFLKIQ